MASTSSANVPLALAEPAEANVSRIRRGASRRAPTDAGAGHPLRSSASSALNNRGVRAAFDRLRQRDSPVAELVEATGWKPVLPLDA